MRTPSASIQGVFTFLTLLGLPSLVCSREAPLFGEPRVLLEHPTRIMKATLTIDGRTLYFCDLPRNDAGATAIWEARRPGLDESFGEPSRLGPIVNRGFFPWSPFLSADDGLLYFSVGHLPDAQLFVARRSPDGRFDEAYPLDVTGRSWTTTSSASRGPRPTTSARPRFSSDATRRCRRTS